MLVGYVSDERDVAIADATVELLIGREPAIARTTPSGAVYMDVAPGRYEAVVAAPGHGRKRTSAIVDPARPHRFRLLRGGLCGYVWPKWARAGERCELRLHATEPFMLKLWRYGWAREPSLDLGRFDEDAPDVNRQVLPDGDVSGIGVRWNRHGYAFPPTDPRLFVEAPQRSGLYYFRMKGLSGSFYAFPWVLAPARPGAGIAVLASTLNWNAYNAYGGRSNYVSAPRLPERPTVSARQEDVWYTDPEEPPWNAESYDPLSFDRPEPLNRVEEAEEITDPMARRGAEHVAPAEWRLLGWLEREGFAYDLYAENQLAEGLVDLDAYRVLVLSTHPEYWTRSMYETVKTWVLERGGKLASIGGNVINCEVELVDSAAMRVLNGSRGAFPPGQDSRFAASYESSAALLGTATTFAGYETGAPYRVLDAEHWAFEGTGLESGDLFGHASLDRRAVGGASGHETDKLTSSAPPQARLLAKGTNPDGGGAEIVHIEFGGGGEVFSVGSISYACSIAIDEQVSAVTANVLRRFLR